jgi:hypothetical protein
MRVARLGVMSNRRSRSEGEERTSRYERDYGHEALYGGAPWERGMEDRLWNESGRGLQDRPGGALGRSIEHVAPRAVQKAKSLFRGRGPKGYNRPDERIREEASERLRDHSFIDASDIEVTVEDGEITLAGTVSDRRVKRLAEDVVEQVTGVHDVHNRLRIKRASAPRK